MPNVYQAKFFNHPSPKGLQRIHVKQAFGRHTLVFLEYRFTDKSQYHIPPENTPMVVRWGTSPLGVRTTYGYVNHYSTDANERGETTTTVVGIGTSKTLNTTNPSSWSGYTHSGIAREIAKRHKMRSIVHEYPFVMESWATGNLTDFLSLDALADEVGYRFWIDNSTLFFLDPKKVLVSAQSMQIPLFTRKDLRSHRVLGGSGAPTERNAVRRQILHGLDDRTNEFFTATSGDQDLPTRMLDESVNTYTEAGVRVNSNQGRENDYYTLEATVRGSVEVYPGGLTRLSGRGISGAHEGLWLTREVEHVVSSRDFETKYTGTKEFSGQPARSTSLVKNVRQHSGVVIRDNHLWEAELQEHVNA